MQLSQLSPTQLKEIQNSLLTGLQVFSPENVNIDLHKPFKTMDSKIVGMVDYKVDNSIEDTSVRLATGVPFIKADVTVLNDKIYVETFVTSKSNEVYRPVNSKEAAVCLFIMINRLLGFKSFDRLGDEWKKILEIHLGN